MDPKELIEGICTIEELANASRSLATATPERIIRGSLSRTAPAFILIMTSLEADLEDLISAQVWDEESQEYLTTKDISRKVRAIQERYDEYMGACKN